VNVPPLSMAILSGDWTPEEEEEDPFIAETFFLRIVNGEMYHPEQVLFLGGF
jgi:hypothetical protein